VHTEPRAERLVEIKIVHCGPVTSNVIGLSHSRSNSSWEA